MEGQLTKKRAFGVLPRICRKKREARESVIRTTLIKEGEKDMIGTRRKRKEGLSERDVEITKEGILTERL